MDQLVNILIPMAGRGKRFTNAGYKLPKPLIDVNGVPMIKAVLDSINVIGQYIFVTRDYHDNNINELLKNVLMDFSSSSKNVKITNITQGAAETCLLAKKHINNDQPLIITNCDQIFSWDVNKFLKFANDNNVDGLVAVFKSNDPRYSYILTDENNCGIFLAEKNPISNLALTGFHYWKKGSYFIQSAEEMIQCGDMYKNEFYVAPTYNYLISKGKKIMAFPTNKSDTHIIGTPEELVSYLK